MARIAITSAFAVAILSASAFAQTPASVLVACQGGVNCPQGGHSSPYTDLQQAIDDAVADSIALNQQVLLIVVGGPWIGNFTIPADANVRMLGIQFNAQQLVTIVNETATPTGGTFTLAFTDPNTGATDTTAAIAANATAAAVQTELEALTTIGAGNVAVTGPAGGPYTVDFGVGAYAGVVVPLLVPEDALTPPPPVGEDAFVLVTPLDGAFNTVIQGAGTGSGAVLTIEGITAADRDAGFARDRLIIEGLTFANGTQGIRINGGNFTDPADTIVPVLDRLYIRDNGDGSADSAGVLVEGAASPLIVNCPIVDNDGDGVRVVDGSSPDLAFADIIHCTIVRNDDNGVFVGTGNSARVRNTIVAFNGTGTGEGGLVWEDNPFIDPDFGPLDGLIPGVGTPIQVTITGSNLSDGANPTEVFFGPPGNPATRTVDVTPTAAQIIVDLPPAYNGIPGPVDVTIRRGDGFEIVVPNGFRYTAELNGADPVPVVWQVDPGWGPLNSTTTDAYVLGAFFDRDCSVFFDLDDDDVLEVNEISPRVQWLSSGRLFVRVPTNTVAGRVDVWVRNNPSGQVSPLGPLEEYEYRAGLTVPGPEIFSIVPDMIDTTAGSGTSTAASVLPDILGANFVAGAVVKIGGIVCPYATFATNRLSDITVPVSEFGGGGVYDVEVINPDGQKDVLPRAFTYFPTSTPGLDLLPWRVSNVVERGAGGARSLLGHGLDFNVDLIADPAGVASTFATVQPIAQREIPFTYPADTDGLGLAANLAVVPIDVMNSATLVGNPFAAPVASTNLVYAEVFTNQAPGAGRAVFFAINSVSITTVGATDTIQLDILNYRNSYNIFVGETQVLPADITVTLAPNPPVNYNGVIAFPAPAQPEGVFGPVDIRVESPDATTENQTGELLYAIAEDAYSYRRAGAGEFPQVSAVTPNTVPDNGNQTIRFSGQNFIGPVASGVFSRIWLDGDATFGNGNEIDLSVVAGVYTIDSISQITKVLDLDAVDPQPTNLIPRDVPVDVVVEQFDAVNGVVLTDGTNPLRSRLIGAITFRDAVAPPTITSVIPNTGPVSGSDNGLIQVTITGTNFGATTPIVLFGTSQARVDATLSTLPTTLVVDLPPAPNGLPGIYDVTVIRTADQIEATLVDGFTYYMDGVPIITQLSPNHTFFDPAAPPATPASTFITIYGYNFDDSVRVTFADTFAPTELFRLDNTNPNNSRVDVLSPYEIVVEITTADLALILDGAADYTGDVATLLVTVQNRADDFAAGTPDADSLTSDPVNFFVYRDGRGDVIVDLPELLYNDVFGNNQDDYINVAPGTGSISVNPVILQTPWVGKLFPDSAAHPLLSTAGPFTEDPYTLVDFELDQRPQGTGAEIGADELVDITVDVCSWYFARVTPNPVGVTPARQLLVEVQFSGNCGGTPFIVPQGGDPRNDGSGGLPNDRIGLTLYQNPGAGYYIYTNTGAITTVIGERVAPTGPTPGDLIADGHAAVFMQRGTNIIGFDEGSPTTPSSDHLDEGGIIVSQAIRGRHFLIDTVPPRIHLEAYGGAIARDDILGGGVLIDSNDMITANDHFAGTHPAGAPPATAPYRPSEAPPPQPAYWPQDDGAILFRDLSGVVGIDNGLQVFFNRGSIANPDTVPPGDVTVGATLDMTVSIQFIDPPVTEPAANPQVPIPGLDFFTGETNRQVAGFPIPSPTDLNEAAGGGGADNILFQGWGRWFPDSTIALTNGTAKLAHFVTGDSDVLNPQNAGVFDPALVPGDSVPSPGSVSDPGNDTLTATWTLTGLPPSASQTWRLRAQFVGEDLAYNATTNNTSPAGVPLYYQTLFDPLQLWWLYDVHSTLSGPSNCEAVAAPYFNVGLIGQRPAVTGQPFPLFSYNLYVSPTCAGPYTDWGLGWSAWRPGPAIDLLADLTPAQEAALNNNFVMIVVLGADEAGNVEPLRFNPEAVDGSNLAEPNAKTFLFTDRQPADTVVGLELWYDLDDDGVIDAGEPVFGDNPIVPYNPFLKARYAVSVNSLGSATGPFDVAWTFHEDGIQTVASPPLIGSFQSNADVIAAVAPGPSAGFFITPAQNGGRLGNPSAAVTYLFTAAAFYNDGIADVYDPTPASAYFVVVPAGVGDFVMSPEDANKQPIKEQGRE